MPIFRSAFSAFFALASSLGLTTDGDEPPRPALEEHRPADPGHRCEGPGYMVWDESRLAAESWRRELAPVAHPLLLCGACQRMRTADGTWVAPDSDATALRRDASYGICPDCARTRFPDLLPEV